jgi:hypothetical protein
MVPQPPIARLNPAVVLDGKDDFTDAARVRTIEPCEVKPRDCFGRHRPRGRLRSVAAIADRRHLHGSREHNVVCRYLRRSAALSRTKTSIRLALLRRKSHGVQLPKLLQVRKTAGDAQFECLVFRDHVASCLFVFPDEGVSVMVSEIDGVDARLERAKENIINLAGEIGAFLRDVCDNILVPDDFNHHEPSVQNVVQLSGPAIPSRLSALAGESIYLMRSALDHLAWHLVIAAGGEPGPRTAFPVFALDPARNEESLATYHGCVEGMSDTAKIRIEKLQPYHRHGRRKQNVLWILNDLSSTDQHTALALRINTYRKQREDGEGAAYLSFARFGKLTDVAVADGLWLLWHATHGVYASLAEELKGPGDRFQDPVEGLTPCDHPLLDKRV